MRTKLKYTRIAWSFLFVGIITGYFLGTKTDHNYRRPAQGTRACPPGTLPYMVIAASKTPMNQWANDSLPPNLVESFISCARRNPNGTVHSTTVLRREFESDFAKVLTAQEFVTTGYQVTRTQFPLGTFLVNSLQCERCDFLRQTVQNLSFNFLHNASLLGQSRSDYRKVRVEMDLKTVAPTMSERGSAFQVISLEAGARGILRLRFSACKSDLLTPEECINAPDGNLQTISVVDLKDADRVKVREVNGIIRIE